MNYKLLDSGGGRRLEKFGQFLIDRPYAEAMWSKGLNEDEWKKADAVFDRNAWLTKNGFPKKWQFKVDDLKIYLKLTPFKHIGFFPEQKFEWDLISGLINNKRSLNILNLFAYTGLVSLFVLKSGAQVTHVDSSRSAITWFKENQQLSGLANKPARIILDDCFKFVEREVKRGKKYDGIIMDPPVYGHGPKGEVWNFSKNFPKFMDNIQKILSNDPFFVIVNAYAVSTSPTTLGNILSEKMKAYGGKVISGELFLTEESMGRRLTTGIYAIWVKKL